MWQWLISAFPQLAQLGSAAWSIADQRNQQNKYEADIDQQIADAMRVAGQIGPETLATYDSSARPQLGELQQLRNRQNAASGTIVSGFEDRYRRAMDNLKDSGKQAKKDIETRYRESLAEDTAFRNERGINSTTAATSGSALRGREREDSVGRLEEMLRAERLATDAGLSGDALGARQWGMGVDAANSGNVANFYGANAANRANLVGGGLGAYLNTIMGINRVPPPANQIPGQVGWNMAPVPKPPEAENLWERWGPTGSAYYG